MILRSNENIHYFAVSNVNDENDLNEFLELIPKTITIVPKIESPTGVSNIKRIIDKLPYTEKVIMLDHDDLFSVLKKNDESEGRFVEYIKKLVTFCEENNIVLLRTIGVIFSDKEKRTTQYLK
jgi:citrate lyase beta subunit